MPLSSITRLRLRRWRFVPLFAWHAVRSLRQVRRSDGCLAADVRTIGGRVFWTRTLWRDAMAMRAYMTSGAHAAAMRKLPHWCDEAAVVHWEEASSTLPAWSEAEARMRAEGRVSRVRHPSPAHARGETVPAP
jgi:quinol monooxygenase YgiN